MCVSKNIRISKDLVLAGYFFGNKGLTIKEDWKLLTGCQSPIPIGPNVWCKGFGERMRTLGKVP